LDTRTRDTAPQGVAKKTGRSQGDLFRDPTPALQQIRKELAELLEILQ
jgi:hypothetical protein